MQKRSRESALETGSEARLESLRGKRTPGEDQRKKTVLKLWETNEALYEEPPLGAAPLELMLKERKR